MSGYLQGEPEEEESEGDEQVDVIEHMFMTTEDDAHIILHHPECEGAERCDCVPVTLVRGAKA